MGLISICMFLKKMVGIDFWCLYEKILLLNELQRHQAGCLLLIHKQNGCKTLRSCLKLKVCFKKVTTKSLCYNSDRVYTLLGNTELRGVDGPSKRRSRRLRRLNGPFNTRSSVFPNRVSLVQTLSL